jgi:hypothetical protein
MRRCRCRRCWRKGRSHEHRTPSGIAISVLNFALNFWSMAANSLMRLGTVRFLLGILFSRPAGTDTTASPWGRHRYLDHYFHAPRRRAPRVRFCPLHPAGAGGQAEQGYSVALSGDGNTAIVGGPGDNSDNGAAWVFVQPPVPMLQVTPATNATRRLHSV